MTTEGILPMRFPFQNRYSCLLILCLITVQEVVYMKMIITFLLHIHMVVSGFCLKQCAPRRSLANVQTYYIYLKITEFTNKSEYTEYDWQVNLFIKIQKMSIIISLIEWWNNFLGFVKVLKVFPHFTQFEMQKKQLNIKVCLICVFHVICFLLCRFYFMFPYCHWILIRKRKESY